MLDSTTKYLSTEQASAYIQVIPDGVPHVELLTAGGEVSNPTNIEEPYAANIEELNSICIEESNAISIEGFNSIGIGASNAIIIEELNSDTLNIGELNSSETNTKFSNFDEIINRAAEVKLPNSTWNFHVSELKDQIIFSKVKCFRAEQCISPIYERQVLNIHYH